MEYTFSMTMNTFFCTVDLQPNILSSDRLSIGLIMGDNDSLFFRYSQDKLYAVKELFSAEAFTIIEIYLTSLQQIFSTNSQKLLRNWVNEGYLSYLEKYNNNLIQFSKTTRTTMPLNQATFDKYFQMYIFSPKKESQKKVYTQEECLTF